ncbi:MAG: transglutaminase domain-containing protein [Anaerolineales bacterium]|nr:transglutaminase domain-containing protein [Anaerolineales bacterium]
MNTGIDPLAYYATLGVMTDPKDCAPLFADLPADIPALVKVVQGLLVHIFWAERYGLKLDEARKQEVNIRAINDKLERILELDDRPLTEARPLEKKLVGNCRDFSVTLCAMLRYKGIPARARCGFGRYFLPDHYEDHWVCEYWHAAEERWVMVDAQLDEFQQEQLKIDFDPLDVPAEQFWTGGKAWQVCRAGQEDPEKFGIFDMHGMWFIRGDALRDLASLNKMEILPWDGWGLITKDEDELTEADREAVDEAAARMLAINEDFAAMQTLYHTHPDLREPAEWEPFNMTFE